MVTKETHVVPAHSSTLSLLFQYLFFIHFVQTLWIYLPFSSNMLRLEREREREGGGWGGDSPHLFSGRATHRGHPKSTKKLSVPLTITQFQIETIATVTKKTVFLLMICFLCCSSSSGSSLLERHYWSLFMLLTYIINQSQNLLPEMESLLVPTAHGVAHLPLPVKLLQ